jgi:UDP-N-acetylmuramoyl-tripeptide--D-alanyl-D-alanine ligase
MRIPLGEAARWLDAQLVSDNPDATSIVARNVSYDSRSILPGELFVAVVAQRDGHDFVDAAQTAGAAAVLVSREIPSCRIPQVVVADTGAALTSLGAWARNEMAPRVAGRVVGITGSVGKTTTKDFIAAALSARYVVGASEKSLNNDQGVPVTLLNTPDDATAVVVEMGMRGFGEIARLAALVHPDIAVITRVGEAHSERVGGIEGVAQAKGELVRAIGPSGSAVLNADDHRVAAMARLTPGRSFTYGTADGANLRIGNVALDGVGVAFTYESEWGSGSCRLPVPGAHMAMNAAAALLVAALCDVPLADAAAALAKSRMSPMRMAVHHIGNCTVLDDTYNASPTSVIAALETVASLPGTSRVAVLGVMAEVDNAPAEHLRVAQRATELGIRVVAYGTDLYGVETVDSYEQVASFVGRLPDGAVVLLKGSRVAGLDQAVRLVLG